MINKSNILKKKIAILGLGYVGLPLFVALSKFFKVVGFDINQKRINSLNKGIDSTNEFIKKELKKKDFFFTTEEKYLNDIDIYIITVPTPVNANKAPDLTKVKLACKIIGKRLARKNIVILESTVYPGVTEEICVPILEKYSQLKFNKDFYCGYSPERINPGDRVNKIYNIKKITSGSTKKTSEEIDFIYKKIINAGTFKAENIKVAEATKVIENAQRDLNIAFVNELSIIFDRMNIKTHKVLEAASTKWNFLKFYPGMVGGHCIGVDPYYLTHKSIKLGYSPKIILAGRYLNDNMYKFIGSKILKHKKINNNKKYSTLILGCTFKEDCNDLRNSQIPKLINHLKKFGVAVDYIDPYISKVSSLEKNSLKLKKFDSILFAVAHKKLIKYFKYNVLLNMLKKNGLIFDFKNVFKNIESPKIYKF